MENFYDSLKMISFYLFEQKGHFFYFESTTYAYGVYPSARNLSDFLHMLIPNSIKDAGLIHMAIEEYIGSSLMANISLTKLIEDCSEY